jgi:pentapeptide MXKDX repeat protein
MHNPKGHAMTTKFTAAALAGALAIVVSAAAATVAFDFAATPAFAQDKKDTMGKDSMSKDSMSKDSMAKDTMSKDGMKKDDMKK